MRSTVTGVKFRIGTALPRIAAALVFVQLYAHLGSSPGSGAR